MIKFTEGGLIDIWPEKDPEIQALSYALQQQFKKLKAYGASAPFLHLARRRYLPH